jgi:putative hydrolase of the HAD superfamily
VLFGDITRHEGKMRVQAKPERTLLLGACGVLVGDPMAPLFAAVGQTAGMQAEAVEAVFRERFRDALWSGQMDEAVFWKQLAADCDITPDPLAWREVLFDAMVPLPAAQHVVAWGRDARLVLLSNHRAEWLMPVLYRRMLASHFDRIDISSNTGLVKPDPWALHSALGLSAPQSALYIDADTANLQVAATLGIITTLAEPDGVWMHEVEEWLW